MRTRPGVALFKRNFVCLILIGILPASLLADDTGAAILHSNGGVRVNGNAAPNTATIFPGDSVEVPAQAAARLEVTGSTVDLTPETLLVFDNNEVHLEHGSVSVNTSRGFRVRAGCVTIAPVNTEAWTHYDVADINGKVHVSALKNDVNLESRSVNPVQVKKSTSSRATVREGEQKTRDEKCGGNDLKSRTPGLGPLLDSPWVDWPAAGFIVGGTLCLVFCFNNQPLSPSNPANPSSPSNPPNPGNHP
jgi:hypothetical protein